MPYLIERFSIAFTANGKRQAEISRLPKTREIYLVSAYVLPVSKVHDLITCESKVQVVFALGCHEVLFALGLHEVLTNDT